MTTQLTQALREKLEHIAAGIVAEHATAVDREPRFPREAVKALGEAGLLGVLSAKDVGGQGLGLRAAAEVVERLARECGSTAMVACMHFSATAVLEKHGSEDVRRAAATGKALVTLALSEAGSRSMFWVALSTAKTVDGGVRLDAKKSFATSASHADFYVWSSKPLAGAELTSLWLMPRQTAGISVDKAFDGLGLRGNDSAPITAHNAVIPAANAIGKDGAGFGIMMDIVLPVFNVLNAACSVGLMESAVTRAAGHAAKTKFEHAGSSIADLPTARAYLAKARSRADMAKTLVDDTLTAIETGRADAMIRVLESKAAANDTALEVTETALRVAGGAAFRRDLAIERFFRDARAGSVMGPTSDALYDFLGKAVCGLPLF